MLPSQEMLSRMTPAERIKEERRQKRQASMINQIINEFPLPQKPIKPSIIPTTHDDILENLWKKE